MAVHSELLRKWKQIFYMYDVTNNGVMDLKDIHAVHIKMAEDMKDKVTPEKLEECLKGDLDIWKAFLGTEPLNMDQFLEKMTAAFVNAAGTFAIELRRMFFRKFDTLDYNSNGFIDLTEFQKYHNAFGVLAKSASEKVFNVIDKNGSGMISRDEFVDAYIKYEMDVAVKLEDCPCFGHQK